YELAQRDALTATEAAELGHLLTPDAVTGDPLAEIPSDTSASAIDEVVVALAERSAALPASGASSDLSQFGSAVAGPAAPTPGDAELQGAGWLGDTVKRILPRDAIRMFTVRQMKDRAGVVGARGVAPLLVELLRGSNAKIHLIGHSYGGKVVLTALCVPPDLPRIVDSVLLLQPAVSHLCFAKNFRNRPGQGGYVAAADRVRLPILSTFSTHDFPLRRVFHLALNRAGDLAELKIAGPGDPPSIYAALGGYGPRRAGEAVIDILR